MRAISSVALWSGLFLLACGRDAQPAAAPEAPASEPAPAFATPPPPPSPEASEFGSREEGLADKDESDGSLASAEADLERAKAELDGVLPPPRDAETAAGAQSAPRASRPAGAADAEAPKAKPEKKSAENSCATACRAFASLGRAAGAVCRLTGEGDARCTRAKGIVSDAERRVTSCGCRTE